MKRVFASIFFLFALSITGCSVDVSDGSVSIDVSDDMTTTQSNIQPGGEWQTLEDGVERLDFFAEVDPPLEFIVYRFAEDEFDWRFEHSSEGDYVAGWHSRLAEPLAVMNGMYFLESNEPAGMLITNGKEVNSNAFDYSRSGLVVLAPEPNIITTQDKRINFQEYEEAGQSYPFLVQNGEASVEEDSGLVSRRSFIGIDTDGNMYLGIVPNQMMSLYELSQYLLELPVKWDVVMNVDGGTSTGLYTATEDISDEINSFVTVPNVIVVERKTQKNG